MSDTVTLTTSIKIGENLEKPRDVRYQKSKIKRYYEGAHSRQTILEFDDGVLLAVGHPVEYVDEQWNKDKKIKTVINVPELEARIDRTSSGDTQAIQTLAQPKKRKKVVQAKKSNKRKTTRKLAKSDRKRPKRKYVRRKKQNEPDGGSGGPDESGLA